MNRLAIFEKALAGTQELAKKFPRSVAVKSILEQLHYLIGLENNTIRDRSKLERVNIGTLTAREIEDMDSDTAELLYTVSQHVRQMLTEAAK